METILTKVEVSSLARPCYADDALVTRCLEEAELFDLKTIVGDELYLLLREYKDTTITETEYDDSFNESKRFAFALKGGKYSASCGDSRIFAGFKSALAYYTYARIVRCGSSVQTRFGLVGKRDDYSNQVSQSERTNAYNEAYSIADKYAQEALDFCNDKCSAYMKQASMTNNRLRFRKIGD